MDERSFIDKLVAPDREAQAKQRTIIKNVMYYFLIGVVSLLATVVVPFFAGGLTGQFELYFPSTTIGWIVYWLIRGGSAALNVCIFALFKLQAVVNVKDDPNYKEACDILHKLAPTAEKKPRSPGQMNAKEWTSKGITIFITSLLAGCTLSALVLVFDLVTFLSCITTVIMGLVFGYITMRKNEIYWTEEYLEYAKMKQLEALASQKAKEENSKCSTLETKNSVISNNKSRKTKKTLKNSERQVKSSQSSELKLLEK